MSDHVDELTARRLERLGCYRTDLYRSTGIVVGQLSATRFVLLGDGAAAHAIDVVRVERGELWGFSIACGMSGIVRPPGSARSCRRCLAALTRRRGG